MEEINKRKAILLQLQKLCILFTLLLSCSQIIQAQTIIRGTVVDSISLEFLVGYTVTIKDGKGNFHSGTVGDKKGNFSIEYPKLLNFEIEISHLAYESKTMLLNKETVAPFYKIRLKSNTKFIAGLEIVASPKHFFKLDKLGEISIAKDHPGMAASFDDPSRSLLRIPAVATQNDQANSISYHGLPSEFVNWKLDGAEILNPNHLTNAGTSSNRPASNSGGVLAVPFEVLDQYKFYPSPFSKVHGNAIAGISDIIPKKHMPNRLGFAKIGLLGMEAGLSKKFTDFTGIQAQYRYSFTGLLGDLGVNFDGEEIRYQDAYLRLHFLDTPDKGIYFTTIMGWNKNDKISQFENINSEGRLGNFGVSYFQNFSKQSELRGSLFYSITRDEGNSFIQPDLNFDPPLNTAISDNQSKISLFTEYTFKTKQNLQHIFSIQGTRWNYQHLYYESETIGGTNEQYRTIASADNFMEYGNVSYGLEIKANKWTIKPEFALAYTPQANLLLEPGITLARETDRVKVIAGSNFSNQNQSAAIYSLNEQELVRSGSPIRGNGQTSLENNRAINSYASFTYRLSNSYKRDLMFKLFNHNLFNIPIPNTQEAYFPYTGIDYLRVSKLRNEGIASARGLEISYDHEFSNSFQLVLNTSLIKSEYQSAIESLNLNAPNDYGFTSNALATKKFKIGQGSLFVSSAIHFRGGAYVPRVNIDESQTRNRTIYSSNFVKLNNYFRIDTRLNYSFKKKNQLILDIQNLTNKRNDGFYNYDHGIEEEFLEKQLGLIPVMSYRREF